MDCRAALARAPLDGSKTVAVADSHHGTMAGSRQESARFEGAGDHGLGLRGVGSCSIMFTELCLPGPLDTIYRA